MIKCVLVRVYDKNETKGSLFVMSGYDLLYFCHSLELPWNGNQQNCSCIPTGTYPVTKYYSVNKGIVFLLMDVPGREAIEIHSGNFKTDTHGCILVGSGFEDINGDGELDVIESKKTMEKLMEILPDNYEITII